MIGIQLKRRSAEPLSMNANFLWTFAGRLVSAACRGILLMLLAKLGTAHMVGQFALAFAITNPVFMFADLKLRSVYATDISDKYVFGHYFGLRLVTTIISLFVIAGIALFQSDKTFALIVMVVGLAKGFETMSDMAFGLYQRQQRMDRLGKSLMVKGLLAVLFMGCFLWWRQSLLLGVIGLGAAWLLVFAIYDLKHIRRDSCKLLNFSPKLLWKLVRLSLPLGIVLFLGSLNRNVSNYIIEGLLGVKQLGYYASMIYLMIVGSTLVGSLGQSVTTKLATLYQNNAMKRFVRLLLKLIAFVSAVGMVAILVSAIAGEQVLSLLYQAEYGMYKDVFVLIMVASAFMYLGIILNYALTATRRFKIQPMLYGIVLVCSVVFHYLLIPVSGLRGAAIALIITQFIQMLGNALVLTFAIADKKRAAKAVKNDGDEGLKLRVLDNALALDDGIVKGWRALMRENKCDIVFCDPDLIIKWEKIYGKEYHLLVLAFEKNGELFGLSPLCWRQKRGCCEIYFAGHPHATHMDFIIKKGYEERVIRQTIMYLKDFSPNVLIKLSGLLEASETYPHLQLYIKSNSIPHTWGDTMLPLVQIQEEAYKDFYKKTFKSHARKNDRRDENRLKLLGHVSFRELAVDELKQIFELHKKRWKKKVDTSRFGSKKSRAFFAELIKNPGRSNAVVYGLLLDERLVGFQYVFNYEGRCLLYRSAHDDLLNLYAPGKMIKRYMVKNCFEAKQRIVDFGIGYEPYKMKWKTDSIAVRTLLLPGHSIYAYLLYFIKSKMMLWSNRLKKHRSIVNFRRNTLGKLKFLLSKECLNNVINKWVQRMKIHGPLYFLRFYRGRRCTYVKEAGETQASKEMINDYNVSMASINDVEKLCDLMVCQEREIIKRFYQKQQCLCMRKDGGIYCCAWVRECEITQHLQKPGEKKTGCMVDGCVYRKKNTRKKDLFELLRYLDAFYGQSQPIMLYMNGKQNRLLHEAAEEAGYIPAFKQGCIRQRNQKIRRSAMA